jgi:hypothetical protein
MGRASREDCIEAVLRVVPSLLAEPCRLKHRELLGDPAFLRARLAGMPPERFARFSSAYAFAVNEQLHTWSWELGGR